MNDLINRSAVIKYLQEQHANIIREKHNESSIVSYDTIRGMEAAAEAFMNFIVQMPDITGVNAWKKEPVSDLDKSDKGWIPAETPPDRNMRVQALIKHHKWIADYDSDWVPEEEKTEHPEWMEICEAIYKNGTFTFRRLEDDEFMEVAYVSPEENIAKPVEEILMWRPIECTADNWIPVEVRLPEDREIKTIEDVKRQTVITTDGKETFFNVFEKGAFRSIASRTTIVDGVIAWQPLPEPYRTKEE